MRKKKLLQVIFISLFFFATTLIVSGQDIIWSDIPTSSLGAKKAGEITPVEFRALSLIIPALESFLTTIPHEAETNVRQSTKFIDLPMPEGTMQRFQIVESPVMEKELSDKFPLIKTFLGKGIDDPTANVRFDWTPLGFHAMIMQQKGFVFIEPYNRDNIQQYISYYQKDLPIPADQKFCTMQSTIETNLSGKGILPQIPSGNQLRTYRLAVAATGEYTAQYGGNVANALAAITTVVNQITLIYEVEVAIRFVLIGNNNLIIYTNAGTDPYSDVVNNPCSTPVRSENQTAIDGVIGLANYDIGHVFTGTNIGGCAAGSVVCGASKAWGASGVRLGSAFDIGLTAHEMGHQFSAGHTFNSNIGSCLGGQYSAPTAYEPGSGTTIMSYAGTCHDIQGFRDMLFHTISYDQIKNFSTSGGGNGCPVITNTGNSAPNVNAGPGGFIIPINTPFILTGSGNDPNGDPLTYSWEEFDLGPQGHPNFPSGTAPIFRSFPPVTSSSRTFPQLSDILSNTQTLGEILPSYARALNFRLTARDNRLNGGGVEYASMSMTVDGTKGPFAVTSPNSFVTWCPGAQTVTWSVNGTNALAANVNILLSTDGGNTFPVTLASNTPNDGSQSVNIPCTKSTMARIKIEAVGNIFFDISNANFTTGDNTPPTFTRPADITIYKDADCNYNASTSITGDVTDENDNCDNTLNATFADAIAAGSCDGETIITRTWTLMDDCGNSTVKVQTITIRDNIPPTFTAPADITIYKDNNCNHNASAGMTGDVTDEDDNCDNTLNALYSDVVVPGSCIGEEIITRTWTLMDDCGNAATPQDQIITVRDTTRPVISAVSANPSVLWPPNHKMILVTINYTVQDNCSPVNAITKLLTAASNEPENGTGDGDTGPDMIVVDAHHVWLRAERKGNGTGRIYTITIHATDDCGNLATTTVNVYVPHNKNMSLPVTSKFIFNETESTDLDVKVLPNPSTDVFNISVYSENTADRILMVVFDMYGRKVENINVNNGSTFKFGEKYRSGIYMIRVMQGKEHKEFKLIKLSE
jgi:Metallo-peptidase family M12/Secretion system C-terminal sorting domain